MKQSALQSNISDIFYIRGLKNQLNRTKMKKVYKKREEVSIMAKKYIEDLNCRFAGQNTYEVK